MKNNREEEVKRMAEAFCNTLTIMDCLKFYVQDRITYNISNGKITSLEEDGQEDDTDTI